MHESWMVEKEEGDMVYNSRRDRVVEAQSIGLYGYGKREIQGMEDETGRGYN